jgi:hypothetical protein
MQGNRLKADQDSKVMNFYRSVLSETGKHFSIVQCMWTAYDGCINAVMSLNISNLAAGSQSECSRLCSYRTWRIWFFFFSASSGFREEVTVTNPWLPQDVHFNVKPNFLWSKIRSRTLLDQTWKQNYQRGVMILLMTSLKTLIHPCVWVKKKSFELWSRFRLKSYCRIFVVSINVDAICSV